MKFGQQHLHRLKILDSPSLSIKDRGSHKATASAVLARRHFFHKSKCRVKSSEIDFIIDKFSLNDLKEQHNPGESWNPPAETYLIEQFRRLLR